MSTMNVSLTPELIKIVHSKVESGLYNNASEVIREAIRQMDANANALHELKIRQLRETLMPGYQQALAGEHHAFSAKTLIKKLNKEKK